MFLPTPENYDFALKSLKAGLCKTGPENFKKIWLGLFQYYSHSENPDNQLADRAALCSLLDLIHDENRLQWLQIFLETIKETWPDFDQMKTDKHMKLLNEWFLTCYQWFNSLCESRKIWVTWNEFLSAHILFDNKCEIISFDDRTAIFDRFTRCG